MWYSKKAGILGKSSCNNVRIYCLILSYTTTDASGSPGLVRAVLAIWGMVEIESLKMAWRSSRKNKYQLPFHRLSLNGSCSCHSDVATAVEATASAGIQSVIEYTV